jgi:hypothetical protein
VADTGQLWERWLVPDALQSDPLIRSGEKTKSGVIVET